jgi:hypothetical protein
MRLRAAILVERPIVELDALTVDVALKPLLDLLVVFNLKLRHYLFGVCFYKFVKFIPVLVYEHLDVENIFEDELRKFLLIALGEAHVAVVLEGVDQLGYFLIGRELGKGVVALLKDHFAKAVESLLDAG